MVLVLSLGMLREPSRYQPKGVASKKIPVVKNAAAWQENWVSGNDWVSVFPSVP